MDRVKEKDCLLQSANENKTFYEGEANQITNQLRKTHQEKIKLELTIKDLTLKESLAAKDTSKQV